MANTGYKAMLIAASASKMEVGPLYLSSGLLTILTTLKIERILRWKDLVNDLTQERPEGCWFCPHSDLIILCPEHNYPEPEASVSPYD